MNNQKKIFVIMKGTDKHKNYIILKNNTSTELPILFNDNNKTSNEMRIIPTTINDLIMYKNNIFNENIKNINVLNNKSCFAEFMINNFKNNFSFCYYYNYNDNTYYCEKSKLLCKKKKIQKPNYGSGGEKIKIIKNLIFTKNTIVTKYHEHTIYYVGHFLVKSGIILKQIFFMSSTNCNSQIIPMQNKIDFILKGNITNYDIMDNVFDDEIFKNIFYFIKYTGFACSDFIIKKNKIIIFEINPRIGGSLAYNKNILNLFWNKLIEYF
jgi:predicted ATP-grasp superfamily ATP-dependent carboligase